jgi:uncharacterized protein
MLSTNLPGSPAWLDLNATDLDGAADFYRSVFGWDYEPLSAEYGLLRQDGRTVAALGRLAPSKTVGWCVYYNTADAESLLAEVDGAGGVSQPAVSAFGTGFLSVCQDPISVEFGLWQPGDQIRGLELVSAPGALVWVELHAAAPAKALEFYRALLGWTSKMTTHWGRVRLFPDGTDLDSAFGGATQLRPGHPAHWLPYFQVTDIEATVAKVIEHGGSTVYPPTNDIAWLRDPSGAYLGAMTRTPPQYAEHSDQ